jgi:hypothetical protein
MSTLTLPAHLKDPFAIIPEADGGFTTQLSLKDRARLHKIIRKVHLRYLPSELLTARECDKLLEAFGPTVQAKLLKDAIDLQLV